MSRASRTDLIRAVFAAYTSADRKALEDALADDFVFTSPYDDEIGKATYFERCWPSGLRIELNAGGYRNYEPDFETVRFEPEAGSNVFYRNLGMPHSMLENFPPLEMSAEQTADAAQTTGLFV